MVTTTRADLPFSAFRANGFLASPENAKPGRATCSRNPLSISNFKRVAQVLVAGIRVSLDYLNAFSHDVLLARRIVMFLDKWGLILNNQAQKFMQVYGTT